MPKRRSDVSRTPRHSPGPFVRSRKGLSGKGKSKGNDRNAEITAFRRTPPVETMDVDGEDNNGDDQELDQTGDYEDDRVRDHATGAERPSSEEVADISNTVPITNSEHEVQTDEEAVLGIIELPLQLNYNTENDKPLDPYCS